MVAVDKTLGAGQIFHKKYNTFIMRPGYTAFKSISISLAISVIFSWQKYFILHTDPILIICFHLLSVHCLIIHNQYILDIYIFSYKYI